VALKRADQASIPAAPLAIVSGQTVETGTCWR
jgi:hypothetical protein